MIRLKTLGFPGFASLPITGLFLFPGAEKGRPSALHDPLYATRFIYRTGAARASLSRAIIDGEAVLEITEFPVGLPIIL